jgi:hypothetical protein
MTNILPPRKNIRNFEDDDLEGKALFRATASILNEFWSLPVAGQLGVGPTGLVGGGTTVEAGVGHSLQELKQLHENMERVVGESSVAHNEEVPIMSYFVQQVQGRGQKVDEVARTLAQEMTDGRAYFAEELSKEAFKNLLLELITLDYWLRQDGAVSAFQEMLARDQRRQRDIMEPYILKNLLGARNEVEDSQYKFRAFCKRVEDLKLEAQKALGVDIPQEDVEQLVKHPLSAKLSLCPLDDLRQHYFKLPQAYDGEFVRKILSPGAPEGAVMRGNGRR